MATKSFGKRGLATQTAGGPRHVPKATPSQSRRDEPDDVDGSKLFLASLPIVTGGLIILLFLIYGLEQRFAFDRGAKGELSTLSLTAFGAASYNLVVGGHQIWRMALAPVLHASFSHFIGNAIALFFIGMRLEPMIGRTWLAAIFVVGAIGGVVGSMIGNPHAVVTVGASGAITGLLGALFAVSFHPRAERLDQKAMRVTALRFGIPAIGPLLLGASGHTDYNAHLGGAIAGVAVALALCAVWSEHRFRPNFRGLAAAIVVGALVASLSSTVFAARGFAGYESKASAFIPESERPRSLRIGESQSIALLTRYPADPAAHLYRAVYLMDVNKRFAAEMELRSALALAGSDAQRDLAVALLAQVVAMEGRRDEAKALARNLCGTGTISNRHMLRKAKLCD